MLIQEKYRRRLFNKVNKTEGCWEWTGYDNGYGYGMIMINARRRFTHRVSWILHGGEIPDGLCVLHKCDNRRCVKPDHLFLGTRKDNALDRAKKNRGAAGECHGMNKLSEADVRAIRTEYATGTIGQKKLADKYGVAKSLVWAILVRRIWKNLI